MIESYSFGSMKAMGQHYRNDLKIIDNKIISNWWRREGHTLYAEDIADILYADIEVLVVGTGAYSGMKVTQEAEKAIKNQGINLVVASTKEAVSIFNKLHAQGKRVAGAFHLTC